MKNYAAKVVAHRWADGWELHIDGKGVTQVRWLDDAHAQVRSYLWTLDGHGPGYDDPILIEVTGE